MQVRILALCVQEGCVLHVPCTGVWLPYKTVATLLLGPIPGCGSCHSLSFIG